MPDAVRSIMDEYERIREKKEAEKNARVADIYKKYPEIEKKDKEIYQKGAENVKKIIKNPEKADELNKIYGEYLLKTGKEREKFLKENGIDPYFDKIKYECAKCLDTGFTKDGKRCECFEKKLIDYRLKKSGLSGILEKENFDNFSFEYYSKNSENGKLSPYENMKIIYGRALKFCENFDTEEKGLVFYGAAGLGKTFLSSCIAKRLTDNGKSVMYISAPRLFMIYEEYRFNRLDDDKIINDIYNSDLLIIDDLGTELQNKNNLSLLFDILNERILSGKKMIISTNYNMNELNQMYSSRFTSRVYEFFIVYGFYGSDIRIEKLKKS